VSTFEEKSELLSWFVDEMRVHVLNHFEKAPEHRDMSADERIKLLGQLNRFQENCKTKLFELHQLKAQGKYHEDTEYLNQLSKETKDFQNKISIVNIQKKQLDAIRKHNQEVDQFTKTFSDKDTLLNAVGDLEIFQENNFMPSQESYKNSLTKDEALDRILFDNIGNMNEAEQELAFARLKKYIEPVRTQR